jgi:hypothetical protein
MIGPIVVGSGGGARHEVGIAADPGAVALRAAPEHHAVNALIGHEAARRRRPGGSLARRCARGASDMP